MQKRISREYKTATVTIIINRNSGPRKKSTVMNLAAMVLSIRQEYQNYLSPLLTAKSTEHVNQTFRGLCRDILAVLFMRFSSSPQAHGPPTRNINNFLTLAQAVHAQQILENATNKY